MEITACRYEAATANYSTLSVGVSLRCHWLKPSFWLADPAVACLPARAAVNIEPKLCVIDAKDKYGSIWNMG
jgi:hypothetical protein